MRFVEDVSRTLRTVSWILGGYAADVYMGRILREHDDIDYLTLNLHQLQPRIIEAFSNHGWQVKILLNGDFLSLNKDDVKVHLGNVEFGEAAKWTHNGEKGSLLSPLSWLSLDAATFYGMDIHVVAPELQYVLKEHPEWLNPDWLIREKDLLDKEHLRDTLVQKGTDICSMHKSVTRI